MTLDELLEYLDGNGLIITDPDEIADALERVGLNGDTEVSP